MVVTDSANLATILTGLEIMALLLVRCRAYETHYVEPDPKPVNIDGLGEVLVDLYANAMRFLAKSKKFLERPTILEELQKPIRRTEVNIEQIYTQLQGERVSDITSRNMDEVAGPIR